jgi:Na+-transporting NADH:ubiquinone oxidoreductase subunit NqrD
MLGLIKTSEIPKDLFDENESLRVEENKISSLVDGIRNKFGFDSICLVSSIQTNNFRKADYSRRHKQDNYIGGLPYPFLGMVN